LADFSLFAQVLDAQCFHLLGTFGRPGCHFRQQLLNPLCHACNSLKYWRKCTFFFIFTEEKDA